MRVWKKSTPFGRFGQRQRHDDDVPVEFRNSFWKSSAPRADHRERSVFAGASRLVTCTRACTVAPLNDAIFTIDFIFDGLLNRNFGLPQIAPNCSWIWVNFWVSSQFQSPSKKRSFFWDVYVFKIQDYQDLDGAGWEVSEKFDAKRVIGSESGRVFG